MALNFDFSKVEGFEWDEGNLSHISKHNVGFRECEEAFSNTPIFINNDEGHSQVEQRYRAYGNTNAGRKLTVIFTVRNNNIRVVSARDQSRKERAELQKES